MHIKIAEQRMKPQAEQNPRTAEEHYQRGVAMMNLGRWTRRARVWIRRASYRQKRIILFTQWPRSIV